MKTLLAGVFVGVVSFEIGPVLASVLTALLNVVALVITRRVQKNAKADDSALARRQRERSTAKRRRRG